MSSKAPHISVLLNESLEALNIRDNCTYIDCTFGAGGHTRAILNSASNCKVIAFDRDSNVKKYADKIKDEYGARFTFIHAPFSKLKAELGGINISNVDGIFLDIGVSSMQLDEAARGFSFLNNGPLDMRMDDNIEISAYNIVNEYESSEIADILFHYGDEKKAKRIAAAIIEARFAKKIETTKELQEIIHKKIGNNPRSKIDSATKTFQALRIAVNSELFELEQAISQAVEMLNINGRLAVITFHSGEDKIVKDFMRNLTGKRTHQNKYRPANENIKAFIAVSNKPIQPSDAEIKQNPRARSAKLRTVEKIGENDE